MPSPHFSRVLTQLREHAPGITLDIMNPSDVSFLDVERGKVDLVINRFDQMPQSFHQITLWEDSFSCLMSADNPILEDFSLKSYLSADHIWVSKTGMGVGVGVDPVTCSDSVGSMPRSQSKAKSGRYAFYPTLSAAMTLAEQNDLIVTLPTRATHLKQDHPRVVIREAPFVIPPLELKMAWSPLLHNNAPHRWIRQFITGIARSLPGDAAR